MLAELLASPARLGPGAGPEVLAEACSLLESAAVAGVAVGGWTVDEPLRLAKRSVRELLTCPRRALVDSSLSAGGDLTNLVLGDIVDAGAKLATLGPRVPPTVDDAVGFLAASGSTFVSDHLASLSSEAAAELLAEAAARLDPLVASWPAVPGAWWPRVEEPARLRLAGGAIVVSGKLDILLGGPPTPLPGLVVELKAGRWFDAVRYDGHLYALLVGLRDGVAPAAVLSVCAGDGATQLEPIRAEVLLHAAERVAEAITVAAPLAAGEPAPARPNPTCPYCPLRPTCPEAQAAA